MKRDEADPIIQYIFDQPSEGEEFKKLIQSLYQIKPDEARILSSLSLTTWFRRNRQEYTLWVQQICKELKREQERASQQKQKQAKLESRDLVVSLLISIPLLLLILALLWRQIFVGKDLGTMIGYVISFLVGSLFLINLIYRVVRWFTEQERLTKALTSTYPWKCTNCGTVVMGTVQGPSEGSSCPKCGGVMVLARLV